MLTKRKHTGAPELGPRLKSLRLERKLTLDLLASKTNISKSMLSQIERGETNPTFAIVWTLTQALRVDLTDLIGGNRVDSNNDAIELLPAHYTPAITSKDGLCILRILSPIGLASHTEWYDMVAQTGGMLASEPHSAGSMEHFTCVSGRFLIKSGESEQHLKEGDTVRYAADVPHAIINDGKTESRGFLLVLT
ncbi:helix-turn-helix domain-containing protein [Kordiimonas pumila]|uniref:Helix-turn-helix domain-containing protein n=1 Tax=Kordiimonas pumila TaxID=2161677 RepID=A0ABV7D105_9PROT|nr:XRE family transcriptional regulator [Kordiimonas pumila]